MREHSNAYAPFSDVRQTDFRITFELVDTNAKGAAQFSATPAARGDVSQLTDGATIQDYYPALEHNMWMLNGTAKMLPVSENVGWWSEAMSNSQAEYYAPPTIDISFGVAISTIGLTINFDEGGNQYPTRVRFTTFAQNGTTVINSGEFDNNSAMAVFDFPSENYYRLKIEFLAAKFPDRRVRMSEIIFGVIRQYNANNVERVKLQHSASVISESIASTQLEFKIDNTEREYDLLSPSNIFAFFQEGKQPLKMEAVVNGEVIDMGAVYYTSAKASDGGMMATITANDKVLKLDGTTITGESGTSTLESMVTNILSGTGIEAEYASGVAQTTISKAIPENTKKREALRMLAQAACCAVWMTMDGKLHFGSLNTSETPAQIFSGDELYNYDGVSISPKVDIVQLSVRDSFANTENKYTAGSGLNVKTINNPCVYTGNGQRVADWLLANYNRRHNYSVRNQGDPALEIGDTVKVYDAYGQNLNAVMTGFVLNYDGALEINTKAVGGVG